MASMHIKKGDLVQVIGGKDRGTTGRVLKVDPAQGLVTVEGVNRVKKHTKAAQSDRGAAVGGILTIEAPLDASNLMVVDPSDNKPTRVRRRRDKIEKKRADGTTYVSSRLVRVSARTGKEI
jgi:large subunit ribosomal protein L24